MMNLILKRLIKGYDPVLTYEGYVYAVLNKKNENNSEKDEEQWGGYCSLWGFSATLNGWLISLRGAAVLKLNVDDKISPQNNPGKYKLKKADPIPIHLQAHQQCALF